MCCVLDHLKNSNQNFTETNQMSIIKKTKPEHVSQVLEEGILSWFDVTDT